MNSQAIETIAWCSKIIFEKDLFKIALFTDYTDRRLTYKVKGEMFVEVGKKYKLKAALDTSNPAYPDTYNAISVGFDIDLKNAEPRKLKEFFTTITSDKLAKKLSETEGIINILDKGDIPSLLKIDGVGESTADRLISLYFAQKDLSEAYVYFKPYGFTKEAVMKICKSFGGVTGAIESVKKDPYSLTKVPGFGFKKVDAAFLLMCNNLKIKVDHSKRFKSYIEHIFEEEYSNGNTWLAPMDLVDKVIEFIPSITVNDIVNYINESPNFFTIDNTNDQFGKIGKRITTKKNIQLEMQIAEELRRIAVDKSRLRIKDYNEIIKATEEEQGWKYSNEQKGAIDAIINNNICIIQGPGGSGKTSAVNAYVNILKKNHYMFAQCALSGKAANNLSLITHEQGSTIHSLIKFGTEIQYRENNPLPVDVVILDEISMVDARIFLSLLKAIPKGGKLIMLGDSGQLDSIGVGVLNSMLRSKAIPSVTLTEIHRQAANSAIITHSLGFRKGQTPSELKLSAFSENIYGNNQDLKYILVKKQEEDEIARLTMEEFKRLIKEYGVYDTQIICSTKNSGSVSTFKLNTYAQIVANPKDASKREIVIKEDKDEYILREGDKVINFQNNRTTFDSEGNACPIFNGNTGILKQIVSKDEIVIDFDGVGTVIVKGKAISNIKLGYAGTVHKFQGSTIKAVILALPYHYLLNSRELVYTGVTRASHFQTVISSPRTIRAALKQTSKRVEKTNLDIFIRELNLRKKELGMRVK